MDFAIGCLAGVVSVLALVAAATRWTSWRRGYRAKRRARRALRGEADAARLLQRAGYKIDDRQVTRRWVIDIDGAEHIVTLRADLIVSRRRRRYVAEVKTGDQAPRIENVSTRRQLLEYLVAYAADGVLLVEPERGLVRNISFPGNLPKYKKGRLIGGPWRWFFASD